MVVYAVWDRKARVRFPAPRLSLKGYEMSKLPTIWEIVVALKEVRPEFDPSLPDE